MNAAIYTWSHSVLWSHYELHNHKVDVNLCHIFAGKEDIVGLLVDNWFFFIYLRISVARNTYELNHGLFHYPGLGSIAYPLDFNQCCFSGERRGMRPTSQTAEGRHIQDADTVKNPWGKCLHCLQEFPHCLYQCPWVKNGYLTSGWTGIWGLLTWTKTLQIFCHISAANQHQIVLTLVQICCKFAAVDFSGDDKNWTVEIVKKKIYIF